MIYDKFELAGDTQQKDIFFPISWLEMIPQKLQKIETLSQALTQ